MLGDELNEAEKRMVDEAVIAAALDRAQIRSLPFIAASLTALFFLYAVVQAFILRENQAMTMILVAVPSGFAVLVIQRLAAARKIPARWSGAVTALVGSLVLFSMLLRLYLTADAKQSANLVLFVIGVGVLIFSARWLAVLVGLTFLGWTAGIVLLPAADDWLYYGVVLLTAAATAIMAYVVRITTYKRAIILRHISEQQRQEIAHKALQLETSSDVGQRITSILNLDTLLQQVAELIRDRYDTSYVGVFLLDESRSSLTARAETGDTSTASHLDLKVGPEGLIGWVISQGQPLRLDDVQQDERFNPATTMPNTRSELILPLKMGQKVMGALDLQSEQRAAFSEEDVPVFQLLADQVSIALENARLYEQTRQFNQQLEATVQARTHDLQQAYQDLEQLDRTKTDFITIASHELRTPLTILSINNQMLLDAFEVQGNDRLRRWAEGIQNGAQRMEEVVESMLDVAKIDSQSLELYSSSLDMLFLLRQVTKKFRDSLAERRLTLVLEPMPDLPPVEADHQALMKVFHHLLVNAVKFTPDGGTITISGRFINHTPTPGIEIAIADTGIGISSDVQELIFQKFYQTGEVMLHSSGKTKFKGGGAGLGLAIAKGIIEAHHGRLWVESSGYNEETLPGSCFYVFLPLNHRKTQLETQNSKLETPHLKDQDKASVS